MKKLGCFSSKTEITSEYENKKNTISTYLKNKELILKSWEKERFANGRKV